MRTHLISILLFLSTLGYAQDFPKVSFSTVVKNPKMYLFNEISEKGKLDLKKEIFGESNLKDSIEIQVILTFYDESKKIYLCKDKNKQISGFEKIENTIIKTNKEFYPDYYTALGDIKTEVFVELLYNNGKFKSNSFEKLKGATRGNFGLLNISKLAKELRENRKYYSDLLE